MSRAVSRLARRTAATATARRHQVALLAGALLAGAAAAAPGAEDDWRYRIEPGDTLIGIAGRWLERPRDWRGLQRLNRVAQPRRLQPGTELRIPIAWLARESTVAELVALAGTVEVLGHGGERSGAALGARLRAGDTLRTGAQSSATVRFADGSQLLVTPMAQVALAELMRVRGSGAHATTLQLLDGDVQARVPGAGARPRFEIRTPVLNLGVRGTEFRARFDRAGGTARAEVLDGRVAAVPVAGTATALAAGFGVVGGAAGLAAPAPLPSPPELGALPTRVERLPLRFAWPSATAAAGWRAQVFADDAVGTLWLDGRFEQPAARWSDLPDGRYVLRVRALDGGGLEGRDAVHAFTLKARPEPPFTRDPPAGARRHGERVRLVWVLSDAAARYRLQVAADPGFAAPLHDLAELAGPEVELALPPGTWHWRLASVRADGDTGPWGDPQAFELRELPAAPAAEPPRVDDGRLLLRWSTRGAGERVQFQIARADPAPDFAAPLVDRTEDGGEIALEPPAAGRYAVRARTLAADGTAGPWGPVSRFEVPTPWWWWLGPPLLLLLLL